MTDLITSACVIGRKTLRCRSALLSVRAIFALAAVLLVLRVSPLAAQEPVFLPGSSWGFVPPAGFRVEPSSQGVFFHPSGALIAVFTSTQKHDRTRFAPVGSVAGQGGDQGRVISIEDATVGGRPAYVMRLRMFVQQADTITLLVQGTTSGTFTAVIPDTARSSVSDDVVLKALYTATERSLSTAEQLSALPVSIGVLAGMRVSGMISTFGTILTDGPGDQVADAPDQTFVTLVAFPPDRAEGYILARDADAFGRRIEESFSGTTIKAISQGVGRNGPHLELTFTRRVGEAERPGLAWSFVTAGTMVLIVVQLPIGGDAVDTASLAAMRDSVSER